MPSAPLYDAQGEAVGETELPATLFDAPVRADLVQRAVDAELWNRRQGTRATRTRTRVRGGGRKPFRQKGTGRARQGSTVGPHMRHGGIAHGPQPVKFRRNLPRKVRQQARRAALSDKAQSQAIRVVEGIGLERISTRDLLAFLEAVEATGKVLLILEDADETVYLSSRNLRNVRVNQWGGISTRQLVDAETLLFTRAALEQLSQESSA